MSERPIVALFVFIGVWILATQSAAAQPWPAAIRNIEKKGVTIVEQFDAPGGMTGFAARAGRKPVALYLTPDGQHVIVGTMLDAEGHNLSQPRLDEAVRLPSMAAAWPLLQDTDWIADGDPQAAHVMYVFTDPNCPYCHKFFERARPWVEQGRLQLRHIPVAILKPSSAGKSAAMLAADNPAAALRRHEGHYRSGGIQPLADIPDRIRQTIAANNQLMSKLGIRGTPGIVYRNDQGQVKIKQGVPPRAMLERVLGPK